MMRQDSPYFKWLVEQTGDLGPKYSLLLLAAMSIHVVELVPHDYNRISEGQDLRLEFDRSNGFTDGSCTVLEMLVALSRRMNSLLYDQYDPAKAHHWFWVLISNLGLINYTDVYVKVKGLGMVDNTFKKLVRRTYRSDGKGGLFPLNNPTEDQRDVEIWYQMQAWVSQHCFD